ncbi:hypothetical protein [Paenibacillus nasutitermitis]|uniref:Uncharacterized protein n=1 Tax=Paenibacillus nasutitermitis TaxID=1652958 RepID=A0A916ZDM7_9BACL|nr:hypothetical protein [Paenibacillus nasutitermitis]GGD90251.1 hypothetical protein GCM10010911_56130 [Paenibacillus nasutitermitis]
MKKVKKTIAAALVLAMTGANAAWVQAATKTVDFNLYPIAFNHINWQMISSHTPTTGYSYTLGTGNGQRTNQYGVSWPDSSYYNSVLGTGGFTAVNSWAMKPVVLYAVEKSGGWLANGWNPYQDMAEGAFAVDDNARAAIMFADDYLLNGNTTSFQKARDLLTFTAYMTTLEGKVYDFAWSDASAHFGWDPDQQGQDKHFMFRSEYVKRTQYPSASPNASWMDQSSDPAHILKDGSGNPVSASPFISHPKYSIYMNDLLDTSGNDVAAVYNGPLYSTAAGGITGYKSNIKNNWTTSTQAAGLDEARNMWAMAKGLQMMQKLKYTNGSLTSDELAFAKFLENHFNRMLNNLKQYAPSGFDSKMASNILIALTDYFQLVYGTTDYGTYSLNLPANNNTSTTVDDTTPQSNLYSLIDQYLNNITSKQYRTSDWRDGIFIDNPAAGNWYAWGELQIYALSKVYKLKRNIGQTPAQLDGLLSIITYSADRFYGQQAYHYLDNVNNNSRTKERITEINGWNASFHTNSGQFAYQNSSIVVGLKELAEAYYLSDRADKTAKRSSYLNNAKSVAAWFIGNNNALTDMYDGQSGTGTYKGHGAVFDGITINAGIPVRNNGAGGESSAEGLWAMIQIKHAISKYGLSSIFTFDY